MTLIDTSVWVDHFRRPGGNHRLIALLETGEVRGHDFVLGELYLGGARNTKAWPDLVALPRLPLASHADALLIAGKSTRWGVGWVDVHLMTAALLAGAQILTLDKRLSHAFSSIT